MRTFLLFGTASSQYHNHCFPGELYTTPAGMRGCAWSSPFSAYTEKSADCSVVTPNISHKSVNVNIDIYFCPIPFTITLPDLICGVLFSILPFNKEGKRPDYSGRLEYCIICVLHFVLHSSAFRSKIHDNIRVLLHYKTQ